VTVIDTVTDTVITTLLPLLHCVQTNVQVGAGRKLLEHPGGAPEGKVNDGGLGDGHGAEERDE
jgi:hypothetical protein